MSYQQQWNQHHHYQVPSITSHAMSKEICFRFRFKMLSKPASCRLITEANTRIETFDDAALATRVRLPCA